MSTTIDELTQHYAAVRKRLTSARLRVVEVVEHESEPQPVPVVVAPEEPPDAPIVPRPQQFSVKRIAVAVAEKYAVTLTEIASSRRTARVILPRHVTMYLAWSLTTLSLPQIGRALGNKDHTTVLHAVRKIERKRTTDAQLDADLCALESQLEG